MPVFVYPSGEGEGAEQAPLMYPSGEIGASPNGIQWAYNAIDTGGTTVRIWGILLDKIESIGLDLVLGPGGTTPPTISISDVDPSGEWIDIDVGTALRSTMWGIRYVSSLDGLTYRAPSLLHMEQAS